MLLQCWQLVADRDTENQPWNVVERTLMRVKCSTWTVFCDLVELVGSLCIHVMDCKFLTSSREFLGLCLSALFSNWCVVVQEDIDKLLTSQLGPRERDIVRLHYGVGRQDGYPMSLETISHRWSPLPRRSCSFFFPTKNISVVGGRLGSAFLVAIWIPWTLLFLPLL